VKIKSRYDVVKPREDLREGKPLDASEFAVHQAEEVEGSRGVNLASRRAAVAASIPLRRASWVMAST